MKKILITGTNGFIGKNLSLFYSDSYHVINHTRQTNIHDCLSLKPDIIINCAGEIYEEVSAFDSNVKLTYELIKHCVKNKTKMIHLGSSSEYGRKTSASKETDVLEPTTFYEATKGAATLLCTGYAKQYNLPIITVRPYSVYGKYEKPHRLFPKLFNSFEHGEFMELYNGYHDFIYIKDFIRGINILVENDFINGDVVNFGSGEQYSNFEVLEVFEKKYNKQANIKLHNKLSKSFESATWICNTSYAYKQYNFKTEFALEKGINDYILYMKK
jgi:nucleoside-diphosphate-sugar epimerase